MLNPTLTDMQTDVDIDDSGPLQPFPVKCIFDRKFENDRYATCLYVPHTCELPQEWAAMASVPQIYLISP